MNREYKKRLQDIGIAEKEASVYITLLESGAATADQTAKGAHLNRSTTYVQLERLMEIGLVTTFKRGKKTFFAAESPQNLERLIEQKRQKLELDKATIAAFIPDLMKVYSASGNAPIVRLYEGKEGITSLRNLILDSKDKAVFIASNIKKTEELYSKPELESYYEQLQKNRLRINVLYSEAERLADITFIPAIKTVEINEQVEKTLGAFSALNAKINTVLSQKKFEDAIGISPKFIGLDTTKMYRVSKKTVAAFDKKLKTKKAPKKKTKIDKKPLLDYKNTKRKNSFKKVKINN